MNNVPKILDTAFHDYIGLVFAAKRTPFVKGPPGSGKSAMTEAYALHRNMVFAEEGGYGYFEIDMSKANIADWQGFLMPEKQVITDHAGKSVEIMAGRYTYPYWAYDKFTGRPIHSFRYGVIVFEEWAQGDPEVKRAAASMIYGRRMGLFHFPDFDCILLGNRDIDRAGATKEYDHIINRLGIAEMTPTLTNFLVVSAELGMTPITQAFAARNETDLFSITPPKEQGPWLTQRSLHAADDIIKAALAQGRSLDDPVLLTAITGHIGLASATKYMAFVRARSEIPTVREVITDPMGCRIPGALDVLTFLVYDLASKTDRQNIGAIVAYIRRLPEGLHVTYFDAVTRRDKTMVSTAEFSAFVRNNLTLMSAVALRNAQGPAMAQASARL
jgi:hypothetical protein